VSNPLHSSRTLCNQYNVTVAAVLQRAFTLTPLPCQVTQIHPLSLLLWNLRQVETEGTGAYRNGIGKFLRTMVKSLTFMITLTSRRKIQIQERQANVAKLLW
jgi:hypothetical protein